ncbi:MAG TPA: EAL domain-containing protein, partial [Candidatus Limnocylindria bacterium]|nr:EAL domain-containing protein [Candidatus Limnocylindria bacterium]
LIMEVSSRALARDPDPPIPMLELMRARGIRVTLDDATDEDAHLVEKLPVDVVKVSRALVSRMGRDHRALDYVRAVVSAARGRGIEATAVGVEDEMTWRLLADIGFSSAQGYLIAAPMPEAQLSEWRAARV